MSRGAPDKRKSKPKRPATKSQKVRRLRSGDVKERPRSKVTVKLLQRRVPRLRAILASLTAGLLLWANLGESKAKQRKVTSLRTGLSAIEPVAKSTIPSVSCALNLGRLIREQNKDQRILVLGDAEYRDLVATTVENWLAAGNPWINEVLESTACREEGRSFFLDRDWYDIYPNTVADAMAPDHCLIKIPECQSGDFQILYPKQNMLRVNNAAFEGLVMHELCHHWQKSAQYEGKEILTEHNAVKQPNPNNFGPAAMAREVECTQFINTMACEARDRQVVYRYFTYVQDDPLFSPADIRYCEKLLSATAQV